MPVCTLRPLLDDTTIYNIVIFDRACKVFTSNLKKVYSWVLAFEVCINNDAGFNCIQYCSESCICKHADSARQIPPTCAKARDVGFVISSRMRTNNP